MIDFCVLLSIFQDEFSFWSAFNQGRCIVEAGHFDGILVVHDINLGNHRHHMLLLRSIQVNFSFQPFDFSDIGHLNELLVFLTSIMNLKLMLQAFDHLISIKHIQLQKPSFFIYNFLILIRVRPNPLHLLPHRTYLLLILRPNLLLLNIQ